MSEDEFWGLTLRELNALLHRRRAALRRAEFYPAQIAAILANAHRDPKRPPLHVEDFMLDAPARPQQTPEDHKRIAKMLCLAFGGEWTEGSEGAADP